MQKTLYRRLEQYKDRWSSFGSGTGIQALSEKPSAQELQQFEIFSDCDEGFLERISPDVSVAVWNPNAVLFEEGSYIDMAFFIVQGEVALYLSGLGEGGTDPIFASAGEPSTTPRGQPTSTLYYSRTQSIQKAKDPTFLAALDFDLPRGESLELGPGEIFGEIGALNGWPQSVTAKTVSECRLVQIRVPALRLFRRKSKALKKRLDDLYRQRSLFPQLRATPLFAEVSDEDLVRLASKVELISSEPGEAVCREGEKAESLYLLRSGFMKVSSRLEQRELVHSYLSKGSTFGEIELLIEDCDRFQFTYTSVGYSELVQIAPVDFRELLADYPQVRNKLWSDAASRLKARGSVRNDPHQAEFINFSLEKGLVQGNSVLVIDLNACTRCDDCVRACSETHQGLPRFVREGDRFENLLIAKACYHCEDPVCLIGCPTGAIRRANVGDVVEINENICIGCSTCANNCPYDAIVMHDTGQTWPEDALPKLLRGEERLLASKCDLCYTSQTGPACVRNCPQGCAYRIGSLEEFQQLLHRTNL